MMRPILIVLLEFVIGVGISVFFTAILTKIFGLDYFNGILIGVATFVVIAVITMSYKQSQIINGMKEPLDRLKRMQSLESKLREMDDLLKKVSQKYYSVFNLFDKWYQDKLDGLLHHIRHTIENDSYMFDTSLLQEQDRIYDVFKGRSTDCFLATATSQEVDWYSTVSGNIFLRGIDNKFQQGKIKELKRLFIYKEHTELTESKVKLCFYLHKQSGYEYKIILDKDFENAMKSYQDDTLVWDFGIYGDNFVWETRPENLPMISFGTVCVNENKITRYKELFDILWRVGSIHAIEDQEIIRKYKDYRLGDFPELVKDL